MIYFIKATAGLIFSEVIQNIYYYLRAKTQGEKNPFFKIVNEEKKKVTHLFFCSSIGEMF